jgi:dTDP-4-amino-4,6-dideoxygalactose transaminase
MSAVNKRFIYLSKPDFSGFQEYLSELYLQQKDENKSRLEKEVESFLGEGNYCTALSSGTSALHLALIVAGVKKGDDVICQSFTFAAPAFSIKYVQANPIFVDSEVDTWNLCPFILEETIQKRIAKGKKPKAIIVVYSYGMPAKIDEITSIAKKYEIVLIEDAAGALGSRYRNQLCGTFGDYGIFSFNTNKIITSLGGGMLVSRNAEDKKRALYLASQSKENGSYYKHVELGFNYRMNDLAAGMLLSQFKVLEDRIEARRKNHRFYKEAFSRFEGITVFEEPSDVFFSNHWLSCILFEDPRLKVEFQKHFEINHIESRALWNPMHLQPLFSECAYYGRTVSEDLFQKGLCLPSSSNLTDEERTTLLEVISSFK